MATKKKNTKPQTSSLGKLRTPRGIASWAFLADGVEDLNGKTQRKITLFFDKSDKEFKKFKAEIDAKREAAAEEFDVSVKKIASPIKLVDDKTIEAIDGRIDVSKGQPYMEFKQAVKEDKDRGMTVVAADGKTPVDPSDVWAGSLVRVSAGVAGWSFGKKYGVKLYLNAVQVLQLAEGQGDGTDVFEDESDEYADVEEDDNDLDGDDFEDEGDDDDDDEDEGDDDEDDEDLV